MSNHIGADAQSHAVRIEHILCDVFGCKRLGFGGIVDSDFIRKQPFPALFCGLSFIYATAGEDKQTEIIQFIEEYSFFSEMSLDFLLSFDTSTKNIDGITIELSFENGKNAVEKMIYDFINVCKRE